MATKFVRGVSALLRAHSPADQAVLSGPKLQSMDKVEWIRNTQNTQRKHIEWFSNIEWTEVRNEWIKSNVEWTKMSG